MIAAIAWASFSVYRSVCLYLFLQVTHKVFQKVGLFETFKIPMDKFLNFFFTLENGYHKIPCKYHVFLSFFPVPYSDQFQQWLGMFTWSLKGCLSLICQNWLPDGTSPVIKRIPQLTP